MDCRTIHHHHAAGGAQGEVEDLLLCLQRTTEVLEADERSVSAEFVKRAITLIRRLAAPAAGKGVDDVLADMRRTTPGDDEHIEALLADYADKIEAALTRQPGSLEARLSQHTTLTRQPVAGDGMVLVPREPTEAMIEAAWESDAVDYVGEHKRICSVAAAWAAMLAAAPAATPTDGGEGKS